MDYRSINRLHKEYDALKRNDSLHGIVDAINNYRSNKGTNFIIINGKKIIIKASSNENYQISNINRIMVPGDSISKDSFSDSIFLFHDKVKYRFILGEVINKKTVLDY